MHQKFLALPWEVSVLALNLPQVMVKKVVWIVGIPKKNKGIVY